MRAKGIVIAIDGPAGSGKSTVARKVAELLGYIYVDTGAMYRAVTLKAMRTNTPVDDEEALTHLARSCRIELVPQAEGVKVLLDGEDVSEEIRDPKVSGRVSQVSAVEGVREAMVEKQRQLGAQGGIVMEGRDIQTAVFPDAELKIFLTASPQERARRRWLELKEKGYSITFEEVLQQTLWRDEFDSTRDASPLSKAPDAIEIDSTNLSAEEVAQCIAALAQRLLSSL